MGLTTEEWDIVSTCALVASMSSLVGDTIVIALYLAFKKLRNIKATLVVYLAIADMFVNLSVSTAVSWFVAKDGDIADSFCTVTGFLLQWSMVSYNMGILTIAVFLFLTIVRRKDLSERQWIMPIFIFVPSLILSLVPFVAGPGYGIAGSWCWLKSPVERLYYVYMIVGITMVCTVLLYALLIRYVFMSSQAINKFSNQEDAIHREKMKIFKKLATFPIVYIIQWIPAWTNRVQNAVSPDTPIVWLYSIHVLFTLSAGAVNCILYGAVNRKALSKLGPIGFIMSRCCGYTSTGAIKIEHTSSASITESSTKSM